MSEAGPAAGARDDKHFHIFNAAEKAMAALRGAELTKEEAFAAIATMSAILMGHCLMDPAQVKFAFAYMEKTARTILPETLAQGRKMAKAASN